VGPYSLLFRPDNDPGSRLAPEVIEEIREVAPSTVTAGSITNAKLAEQTIEESKYADKSVSTRVIGDGAVDTLQLAAGAVTADKVDDHTLVPLQMGTGILTIVDSTDTAINLKAMRVTAAQMATINAGTPDPNTLYVVN
jgi:hypothetical protein